MSPLLRYLTASLLLLALSGCEDGRVDVNLSADKPGTNLQRVVVTVEGISLQRADGSEDQVDLQDPAAIDLMDFDTSAASLLDGEALDSGDYTGIRLRLLDGTSKTDNFVVDVDGTQRPLTISDLEPVAPLLFSVKKNAGKTYALQLRMDLRSSLSADGENRSLKPVLRAVRSNKAASVSGSVANGIVTGTACKGSKATGLGVAVYAFRGHDLEPDDADAIEPNPIASAPVTGNTSSGWSYRIESLPPGDYTLALTCNGDIDDGQKDDSAVDGRFKFIGDKREIDLEDAEARDLDFRN